MPQSTPRTTVIMPVYGTAAQVVRAIESVRAQTDPDFELIVLNDQSPDDADQVITEHLAAHPDPRIRYEANPENLGPSETRNRGLALARGQWLAFLDSDDAFAPAFLQTLHAAATEEVDVVACMHDVVYPDGTRRYRQRGAAGTFTGPEAMHLLMRDRITPYLWDKLYRASACRGRTFPDINRAEDAAFNIPLFQQARHVRILADSLVLYSVNPRSITWGSVPPLQQLRAYTAYLQESTGAGHGSREERKSMAAVASLAYLNGAQSALRLQPEGLDHYLAQVRQDLTWGMVLKTLQVHPLFGAAGTLLKVSPQLYKLLYGAYVKRQYGL